MIVTSTDSVEGREIADYLGIVSVRGGLYGSGRSGLPFSDHKEIHDALIESLVREGQSLGADALVGLSVVALAPGHLEVAIYTATAVRFR